MYGSLMLTDTNEEAEKMLTEMGLDPELVADKGHHAYWEKSEVHLVPESDEADQKLYSKINTFGVLKYYISHPNYLYKALEVTANHAINPAVSLFVFQDGALTEDVVERGRFTLWEKVRYIFVPHHFWQYVILYLCFFAIAFRKLYLLLKKHLEGDSCWYRSIFLISLYILIMLIGILQYPLPFIGNGFADTNKQLYLFMLCWDITVYCTLCWAVKVVYGYFTRRKKQ